MEKPVVKKAKAPIASIILSALGILGILISIGFDITFNFIPEIGFSKNLVNTAFFGSSQLIGMIIFLIGLFLHRKNGNILCGIGVVLNALPVLKTLFTGSSLFFISTDLIITLFLVIAAVFYFTKIKVLGMPLKLIFGLFAIIASFVAAGGVPYLITQSMNAGAGIVADLEGFFYTLTHTNVILFGLISNLLTAFTSLYFYAAIVLFTPKKG